jgi:molybdopterin molybdotransferase
MISVEEAKSILINNVTELTKKINVPLIDALGLRLAEDIYAPLNLPPFDQSNVDGYAVCFSSKEKHTWKVIDEIKAGDRSILTLKEGNAVRIFTGAMVPAGSDCVIMQEKVTREGNTIQSSEPVKQGEHIRKTGAQIKKEELALPKGTIINPAILGFLSGLGLSTIPVYQQPKISLIITGNELQTVGSPLEIGKVYESNSFTLQAALQVMGLKVHSVVFVKDNKQSLEEVVTKSLEDTDLLLISGGISVGDYDFAHKVLTENNTITLFYKVAQKPGKPLFFGKNNNCMIFGLPGNPASALTCFYEYVYPALQIMRGRDSIFLNAVQLLVLKDIYKKKGLANYLKAEIKPDGVLPLNGQESFIMKSFADAGAFIYLPMEKEDVYAGELVEVHILPNV